MFVTTEKKGCTKRTYLLKPTFSANETMDTHVLRTNEPPYLEVCTIVPFSRCLFAIVCDITNASTRTVYMYFNKLLENLVVHESRILLIEYNLVS